MWTLKKLGEVVGGFGIELGKVNEGASLCVEGTNVRIKRLVVRNMGMRHAQVTGKRIIHLLFSCS